MTLKNVYAQYDGNEPIIYGDKGLDVNGFSVLETGAPFLCDKILDLKANIWNEALTYLGISNVDRTKRERMITSEVERGQGGTIASRLSRLKARQQAAEQINKMFNLDISVEYNTELIDELTENEEAQTDE